MIWKYTIYLEKRGYRGFTVFELESWLWIIPVLCWWSNFN